MKQPKQEVIEDLYGPQEQSRDEKLKFSILTTPWGGSPANPVVHAYDAGANTDVTAALFLANVPTVLGDVITTDILEGSGLVVGKTYRVEIGWDDGDGLHWVAMFRLLCVF